jgi:ATP-dependent Clp protease ATP-binding subunit ClpC
LAEQFCGTADAVTRVDCSELMERHSISKLIGSPPGKRCN